MSRTFILTLVASSFLAAAASGAGATPTQFVPKAAGAPPNALFNWSGSQKRFACRVPSVGGKPRYGHVLGSSCEFTQPIVEADGDLKPPASISKVSTSTWEYVTTPTAPHGYVGVSSMDIHRQLPALAIGDNLCQATILGKTYFGTVFENVNSPPPPNEVPKRTRCAVPADGGVAYTDNYTFFYPVALDKWANTNIPITGWDVKPKGDGPNGALLPPQQASLKEWPCVMKRSGTQNLALGGRFAFLTATSAPCYVGAFGNDLGANAMDGNGVTWLAPPKNGDLVARNFGPTPQHKYEGSVAAFRIGWRALWIPASQNQTPEGALTPATNGGKPNYICRKLFSTSAMPQAKYRVGRTWHGTCYIGENVTGEHAFTSGYDIAVGDP